MLDVSIGVVRMVDPKKGRPLEIKEVFVLDMVLLLPIEKHIGKGVHRMHLWCV